jgi:hypothetical protein
LRPNRSRSLRRRHKCARSRRPRERLRSRSCTPPSADPVTSSTSARRTMPRSWQPSRLRLVSGSAAPSSPGPALLSTARRSTRDHPGNLRRAGGAPTGEPRPLPPSVRPPQCASRAAYGRRKRPSKPRSTLDPPALTLVWQLEGEGASMAFPVPSRAQRGRPSDARAPNIQAEPVKPGPSEMVSFCLWQRSHSRYCAPPSGLRLWTHR